MPKELIYSPSGASAGAAEPRLSIGWTADREHVEIATIMPEEGLPSTPGWSTGWFLTLDRAGVNKAIRVLRRARDQAFGKDE